MYYNPFGNYIGMGQHRLNEMRERERIKNINLRIKRNSKIEDYKLDDNILNSCSSNEDIVSLDEFTSDDDIVIIYNSINDIGKKKGQCYKRENLIQTFLLASPVTEWAKKKEDGEWENTMSRKNRVYKLPQGIWITGISAVMLTCSKLKHFYIENDVEMKIGSQLGVSQLHGAVENVRRLMPLEKPEGSFLCDVEVIKGHAKRMIKYLDLNEEERHAVKKNTRWFDCFIDIYESMAHTMSRNVRYDRL